MVDDGGHFPVATSGGEANSQFRLITLGGLTLLDGAGRTVTALGPQNLALLAYLALASRPLTRDHVAELFWGDRDENRARHSMREALSKLRQVLGPEAIARRSDRVMLDSSVQLSVDARMLAAAASAGDSRTVVALYAGPFLDGVHTAGSRSFEDWGDAERAMYEARFVSACATECARLRDESPSACAELARRWLHAAPLDPKASIELLRALAAPDSPEALRIARREYQAITERLANDFDLAPHPGLVAVADAIARRSEELASAEPVTTTPEIIPIVTPLVGASAPAVPVSADARGSSVADPVSLDLQSALIGEPTRRRAWKLPVALAAVLLVAVVSGLALSRRRAHAVDNGMLAVVPFEVVSGTADRWLAAGAPRLIAASLTRDHVVGVVDASRVREVLPSLDSTMAPSASAALAAARNVGARWLLSGTVISGSGRVWLDMRLNDLRRAGQSKRVTVSDSTLDAAVARGTAQLVTSIDAQNGGAQLVDFEPRSVNGYRAFIRATQLRGQMRDAEATAVLDGAIAADSGFVAAIMERRFMLGMPSTKAKMDTARALDAAFTRSRARATDFERLYFDAYVALHNGDHERAETDSRKLVERYPSDPRAYHRALEILVLHGRFDEASALASRAILVDSSANTTDVDACRFCGGYRLLSEIALRTGDLPRAEATARRATELGPHDASAWAQLATVLSSEGRFADALSAGRRAGGIAPTDPDFAMLPIRLLLEAREYDGADSSLQVWSSVTDPRFALQAADMRMLLLRERGRFEAASRVAATALERFPADSNWLLLVQGETLARLGDISGTRRVFAAAVSGWPHERGATAVWNYSGDRARSNTWPRAILADALWQQNAIDQASLASLADSIQASGAESYFARDWRLHHHVRGLIAMRERRWADAERELKQSLWGREAWPRSLVELANAQFAQGKTAEGIRSLRDAYTSPLSAMGRYVPRSELDLHMARGFMMAGETDSARVYARYVSRAWSAADPGVRRQLALLSPTVSTRQVSVR